jgi:hypothetical protein
MVQNTKILKSVPFSLPFLKTRFISPILNINYGNNWVLIPFRTNSCPLPVSKWNKYLNIAYNLPVKRSITKDEPNDFGRLKKQSILYGR